jgi:hypothetical protein
MYFVDLGEITYIKILEIILEEIPELLIDRVLKLIIFCFCTVIYRQVFFRNYLQVDSVILILDLCALIKIIIVRGRRVYYNTRIREKKLSREGVLVTNRRSL